MATDDLFAQECEAAAPIDRAEVERRVIAALDRLIQQDRFLLEADLHERTITHKLAEHLQAQFSDWDVDCEYNRDIMIKKMLSLPALSSADQEKTVSVYPDIIVHHRKSDENLLILEIKKYKEHRTKDDRKRIAFDKRKLAGYTGDHYHYQYGLFLELTTGQNIPAGAPFYKCEWWVQGDTEATSTPD